MRSGLMALALATMIISSCNSGQGKPDRQQLPGKNEMADLNRYLVRKDKERIENYIVRKDLKMKETPSGLWYLIINEGKGNLLTEKDKLKMEYECYLLDGTKCYSSDELGLKEIIIGKTVIEPGIDQGLRMMRRGGEAMFILPPFMAYGLPGDGKKIPSRAIIVYKVRIMDEQQ